MIVSYPLLSALLQLVILLPFIFMAKRHWEKSDRRIIAVFFVLFLLWSVLTTGLSGIRLFETQQWNWTGKLITLLLGLFFIYRSKLLSNKETGLRARFAQGSFKPVVILLLAAVALRAGIYFAFQTTSSNFNTETVLFQGSLSAISDEIIFRGILLALLNKVFTSKEDTFGFSLSWGGLISSLLFGLTQGFVLQDGLHLQINLVRILLSFFTGIIAALLKERSENILPAIVFHALWNLIGNH